MIVFLCVCVSVIVWNAPLSVLLCVWLCAQTCWLVADNSTRGCVFVDLLAEEIPTVLSVSGLCMFLGLHAWLCQLFYSPVGPLNPTQPSSLADPLLPSEACSSSDKGRAGQALSRAPQSPSEPLHANNTPSFPSTLTPFTCENTGSYLQFTGAMAQQPSECMCACSYMCEWK